MDLKILLTVFTVIFVAEIGDKTQLATMLFAADKEVSKFTVFLGASLALIAASAIGVLAGLFGLPTASHDGGAIGHGSLNFSFTS